MMEKKNSILRDYQDMSTDKNVDITLTLRYDYAILQF